MIGISIVNDYYLVTKEYLVAFLKWLQYQDINRGSPVVMTNINTRSFTPYRSITPRIWLLDGILLVILLKTIVVLITIILLILANFKGTVP